MSEQDDVDRFRQKTGQKDFRLKHMRSAGIQESRLSSSLLQQVVATEGESVRARDNAVSPLRPWRPDSAVDGDVDRAPSVDHSPVDRAPERQRFSELLRGRAPEVPHQYTGHPDTPEAETPLKPLLARIAALAGSEGRGAPWR